MSKKLIAGAGVVASFAVALAPLATFATFSAVANEYDAHTDDWTVTVLPACAFGDATASTPVTGVSHDTGAGTTGSTNISGTNASAWVNNDTANLGRVPDDSAATTPTGTEHVGTDTATYTIYAGTVDDDMGSTTLTVVCTNSKGYRITAAAADLAGPDSATIPVASTYSATASGYNITTSMPTTITGATIANVTADSTTTPVIVAEKDAAGAAAGESYKFTYGIGVQSGQPSGDYTGTVVYKLYQQVES